MRSDCGPSNCGAGRAAGQEMTNIRGRAGCGLKCILRGGLRAQISSPAQGLTRHPPEIRYTSTVMSLFFNLNPNCSRVVSFC